MTRTFGCLLLACAAITADVRAQGAVDPLRQLTVDRLESIAGRVDGVVGYAIVDLETGDRFERLAGRAFPTASSIKLGILYELFKQAEEGRVKLDDPVPWDAKRAVGGSGVLFKLSNPTLTLRDYATLMIVLSDNTATNIVIDAVGMDRVNARMQAMALGDVRLRRKMIDLEAARRGDENVATPTSLAGLLAAVEQGKGLAPASRDAMLAVLKKGKTSPMLRGIPADVPVASKPGALEGVRADAGIVYLEGRPFVFVAMATWLQDDAEGERAIEELSRAAFQYFKRLAVSNEYGRRVR